MTGRPGGVSRLAAPLRILTPVGRGTLVLGLVVIALASQLHWQEFTQLGVAALALVVLALLWQLPPARPTAELTLHPTRTTVGAEPATITVRVDGGAMPLLFPEVTIPVGERSVSVRLPFLAPFAHHVETMTLPDLPRGAHVVGPVLYDRSDPMGMLARQLVVGPRCELLVAPRVTDLSLLASGLTNDLDGAASQQLSMSDLAFHALREYVPGDDLRHVHWRSSAKAGELLVRQYHETRHGHVTILLDDARTSHETPQDFELAVAVALSIALRAARDDLDTYVAFGRHVVRGRHVVELTEAACRVVQGPDHHVVQAATAAESVGASGLVVQVTGERRDAATLDAAAASFGRGAERIVVRAATAADPAVRVRESVREVVVPDLARLDALLSQDRR